MLGNATSVRHITCERTQVWLSCVANFLLGSILLLAAPQTASPGQPNPSGVSTPSVLRESVSRLIESGRLDQAQNELRLAKARENERNDILYLEALLLFKQQQYEASLEKVREVLALQPTDAGAQFLLARNAVVLNQLDLAESALKTSAQLSPGDHLIYLHLGLLYFSTNRFALARKEFEEVTRLNPRFMKGYDLLALSQEEVGSVETVLAAYQKAIQLAEEQHLQDESPYLHLAKFLWQKNRVQDGLVPAKRATELNPRSAEAYCLLGRFLDRLGQVDPSAVALQESVRIDPLYVEAHYLLSRVYQKQGKQEEALTEMRIFQEARKRASPRN